MSNKKSQSSIEFIVFLGIALLIMIAFSIVSISYLNINLRDREVTSAQDLAKLVKNEINLASRVEPGYTREVQMPATLDNKKYKITADKREVFVEFDEPNSEEEDFIERLATKVSLIEFVPNPSNQDENKITILKCGELVMLFQFGDTIGCP
tara:strand:- start:6478 stop:6933 length:456 start_codon:yes stop_codon:yes gene_type:complete